jgi:hypothetical protein
VTSSVAFVCVNLLGVMVLIIRRASGFAWVWFT